MVYETFKLQRVVSGGQSGVDRGALDAALEYGLPCGGWCPAGRLAEDGPIAPRYPLQETPAADYTTRTEWNVRDSDGTLILIRGRLEGGTLLTRDLALRLGRTFLVERLDDPDLGRVVEWLTGIEVATLNVAGPRESKEPGIAEQTRLFLLGLLARCGARR